VKKEVIYFSCFSMMELDSVELLDVNNGKVRNQKMKKSSINETD
jgi:hypothetical protein